MDGRKRRLNEIKKEGGEVKQTILSQGVKERMSVQEVAVTMYTNESAFRKVSSFMVNRPVVDQIQRAGTLNKNRKLETTVNDIIMVELFQRYKVEYNRPLTRQLQRVNLSSIRTL